MAKEKKEKEILNLDELIESINKECGDGAVMKFSDKQKEGYQYISTDSIAFDEAIGGGFIRGKLYELVGWEGAGKSTICGHAAKNAQKSFPDKKVLYVDSENSLDATYFETIGVDVEQLYIVNAAHAEQGFGITEKMINTGEFSLVIIDSDTSMQPKSVVEGEMGANTIGIKARLNGQAYPKLHKAINKHKTAMIVVSQYREKIGVMFGDPRTTNGGHALKFTADCRIEVSKSLNKENDEVLSSTVSIKAIKNRMHSPFKKASFIVTFGIGIDKKAEVMDLANSEGIIKKWGKTITYNDEKFDLDVFEQMLEEGLIVELTEKIKNNK